MRQYLSYDVQSRKPWKNTPTVIKLLLRDGFLCAICHEPMTVRKWLLNYFGCYLSFLNVPRESHTSAPVRVVSSKQVTIDHIIRKANGGGNELTNLRLVHESCNRLRKDYSETYYKSGAD